jgi:hypothetical protein
MRAPLPLAASVIALMVGSACTSGLYAPCEAQWQCGEELRCVNLGGDTGGLCTRACSIVKSRAGFSDAADDDKYFEDGAGASDTIAEAQCSDGETRVTTEDTEGGPQKLNVEAPPGGVVGVCRISAEQIASTEVDGDSVLTGFCTPI